MLSSLSVLFISLFTCSSVTADEVDHPSVGVIRWDAWNLYNGKYDFMSNFSHKYLSLERFHYRLPFFAKIFSDNNVTFNGDIQAVMDQEILYAKMAGFDYWAFDTYCSFGPNCATNITSCVQYAQNISIHFCPLNPTYGLKRYLSSQYVSLINFTLLLLHNTLCDDVLQESYIELMVHPQFQTVLDGRPLLYLFEFGDLEAQLCGGGWEGSRRIFDNFRQKLIARGLKNPYLVLMDGLIPRARNYTELMGFDAISSYGLGGGGSPQGAPFSDEVQRSTQWWNSALQSGAKVILPLSTGWDPRPRHVISNTANNDSTPYFLQPTAEELQNFIKTSVELTCAHKNMTEAQTVIIYAWNECDENGAALIPSLGNGTYYVRALAEILPMTC